MTELQPFANAFAAAACAAASPTVPFKRVGRKATFCASEDHEPLEGFSLRELMMRKGPVARQLEKEEVWKRKLTREKAPWWDIAATGMLSDPALRAGTPALTPDSGLRPYLSLVRWPRSHPRTQVARRAQGGQYPAP